MSRLHHIHIFAVPFLMILLSLPFTAAGEALLSETPESAGFSSERMKRIDAAVNAEIARELIPGAVTLVARHGRIVHVGEYGYMDRERGIPMRRDALFRIASMTKPVTSLAALILFEEGHFLLTDPVSKFIPEFKNMTVLVPESGSGNYSIVPAKREITIRHLLSHTAGLIYGGGGPLGKLYADARIGEFQKPPYPIRELVMALAELPLAYHPGENFRYSL